MLGRVCIAMNRAVRVVLTRLDAEESCGGVSPFSELTQMAGLRTRAGKGR